MRLSQDLPCRTARLLFVVVLVLTWSGGLEHAAAQPAGAPGPGAGPATGAPRLDRKQAAEAVNRLLKVLEAADKEVPRETFDPRAVIDQVGREPAKLFEWVRDNTHWVPYHGALRGPRGVLMDRVGSSLDRALLLAELLRGAGHAARLSRTTLTEEQATDLLAKARPLPKDWLAAIDPPANASEEQFETHADRVGLDPGLLRTGAEKANMDRHRRAEAAAARIAEQAPVVLEALNNAPSKRPPADARREALAAARDHWWVSAGGAGAAVHFDVALPDATAGKHLGGAASATIEYDGTIPADSALCHEVEVRVTVERRTGGKLEERPVLTHVLRPADVLGQRVALAHAPLSWPAGVDLATEPDVPAKLKELAARPNEWVPVLTVGGGTIIQGSFDDGGNVNPKPALNPAARAGAGAGGAAKKAADAFDLDGLGAPPRPQKPTGELTAEWIDYEIRSPGRAPVKVRRQLFDLIGPAARAGGAGGASRPLAPADAMNRFLAALGESEILLQPCTLSQPFVNHVTAGALLANRQLLLNALAVENPDAKFVDEQLAKAAPPPGAVLALAARRLQWSDVRGEVYFDRPNVLSQHSLPRQAPDGSLLLCEGFDIVFNAVAVRSSGGENDDARAAEVRARQGVTDTVTEALLAAGCGKVENASELFAADSDAGAEWVTLRGKDELARAGLALPPDILERVRQDLEAGYVVVAPRNPVRSDGRELAAWWRIDPATGQTLGVGQLGWGQTAGEYAFLVARLLFKGALFLKCIGGAMGGVGAMLLCTFILFAGGGALAAGGTIGNVLAILADIGSMAK